MLHLDSFQIAHTHETPWKQLEYHISLSPSGPKALSPLKSFTTLNGMQLRPRHAAKAKEASDGQASKAKAAPMGKLPRSGHATKAKACSQGQGSLS